MKRSNFLPTLLVLVACLFAFSSNAQIMTKGTRIAKVGVGLGAWSTAYTTSQTPLMNASFEMGIKDNLGPGNLSVGGTLAFKSGKYNYLSSATTWKYNYFAIAGRASYHPHFIKSEKLDAYAGLSLGYYGVSVNASTTIIDDYAYDASAGGLALAGHIGARYNFTENIGAWAELGYGLGFLNAGISYKF